MRLWHSILIVVLAVFTLIATSCSTESAPAASPSPIAPATAVPVAAAPATAAPAPPTLTALPPTAPPAPTSSPAPTITLTPIPRPIPRGYHVMAYDPQSDTIILWGGQRAPGVPLNDTWTIKPGARTWMEIKSAQSPPKGLGPVAYDSNAKRFILYIGALDDRTARPFGIAATGQTWAYDPATRTWTDLQAANTPKGILGPTMAYDAESDRMVLFGGGDPTKSNLPMFNDTWVYDAKANAWMKMTPQTSPLGRNFATMAYNTSADRVILFGGDTTLVGDPVNDTWAYDYNTDTWTKLVSDLAPAPRTYSAMVYDAALDRIVLFGGTLMGEKPSEDTWAFDYKTNTWTELAPKTAPSMRGWHSMAYAAASKKVVLFGGGATRNSNTDELWLYDPATNVWSKD